MQAPPDRPKLQSDYDFNAGLKASVIGHLALIFLILVKSLVFPGKPLLYIPTLKVDIVGLPDVLKKDLKANPESEAAQKEIAKALKDAEQQIKKLKTVPPKVIAKKDEMVLKPKNAESAKAREKKLKSALDRIKALNKITSPDESDSHNAPKVIKGNKISKGSSLSGDARESDQTSYYDALRERLQENWSLPVWLSRKDLSAQVQIFIDSRGKLRNFRFTKTSGNSQFDDAVKKTLKKSEPFPVPSDADASTVLVDGVLIGFPL